MLLASRIISRQFYWQEDPPTTQCNQGIAGNGRNIYRDLATAVGIKQARLWANLDNGKD